ncbi:hypothetical protein FACS189427_07220 [Planctomycetales bacterium]|nr:hypothetical protein FACS189427_07220 [Planctomycetales bacterium]
MQDAKTADAKTLQDKNPAAIPAATPAVNPASTSQPVVGTRDPVLGERIARISNDRAKLPKEDGQFYREFDITPYTKGRTFPAGVKPEQTIVNWILRLTGKEMWHNAPFGFMTCDANNLYVYQTEAVQKEIADVVDRFVAPQFANDSCKIRIVTVSRPDWQARGRQYLRSIPILTPGVQGWIVEKNSTLVLLQDLARRNDFKEIAPPQFVIPNGTQHQFVARQQRTYLRDVQPNAAVINGYAEDKVNLDEGISLSFVPLSVLDRLNIDAIIKLDIVRVEKMQPLMIDVPTAVNPRQRVQIEIPQIASFHLDEQIRWPKDKVLLLDLGMLPLPGQEQTNDAPNILSGLTKNLSSSNKVDVLLFIEPAAGVAVQ